MPDNRVAMGMEGTEAGAQRYPLAGKWNRRLVILAIFLFLAYTSLGGRPWYLTLIVAVLPTSLALAELRGLVLRRGDYIEFLADGILLVGGIFLWNVRIAYESVASAELKDVWSDRAARRMLRIIGRTNPPRVELRLRRRVFSWLAIWPLKKLHVRPEYPEAFVAALSARLGVA
jgi:hypothetical protein